ncbi:helix-turn-helix domain-containing protein [Hymenobacter weizhouensis]|uniref:helix-turn-helix domain-containing protein n=1 Tax=Hymenobacter sp. YIM 151500-1 TaxID=2987689 RepID=UPI0022266F54|nr:helix-turn-helix domain-containing protein [Hymenobacter sp. YIM 151500-1]UYZ62423.1 helix-turn-helix domain-containing protein [Hymenobacter sp. YIM 151500-1]
MAFSKTSSSLPLQTQLFAAIRAQAPAHLSLADEIADVLGLSTDSAYRRLRGETALSLDEAGRLAQHFNIALHDLLGGPRFAVAFQRVSINALPQGLAEYLAITREYFEQAARGKEKLGAYAAKDIPAFYHFLFPELARFKLFFWLKTIKAAEAYQSLSFAPRHIPDELVAAGAAAARQYLSLPLTEIWNDETANSTLGQIEYYHQAGLYEQPTDAQRLLDEVEALIRHIQHQAVRGATLRDGAEQAPYQLYYNEILLLDNTIFTVADGLSRVLLTYNGMDYLHTSDAEFCGEVQHWLRVQTEKSTLISRVSEKERNRFFNKMYARIDEQRRRLH